MLLFGLASAGERSPLWLHRAAGHSGSPPTNSGLVTGGLGRRRVHSHASTRLRCLSRTPQRSSIYATPWRGCQKGNDRHYCCGTRFPLAPKKLPTSWALASSLFDR